MENAGGHGTDDAITEYTKRLKEVYNIEIIHQIPRSPFTNVLDLGVWDALQAAVEKQHFMKRCSIDALVNTVNRTWNDDSLDRSINNVFIRLQKVLCLINEGDGGNNLVETKRGVKNKDLKFDFESNLRKIMKSTNDYLLTNEIDNTNDGNCNEIPLEDQEI